MVYVLLVKSVIFENDRHENVGVRRGPFYKFRGHMLFRNAFVVCAKLPYLKECALGHDLLSTETSSYV